MGLVHLDCLPVAEDQVPNPSDRVKWNLVDKALSEILPGIFTREAVTTDSAPVLAGKLGMALSATLLEHFGEKEPQQAQKRGDKKPKENEK